MAVRPTKPATSRARSSWTWTTDLVAPDGPGPASTPLAGRRSRARLEAAGIGTEHEVVAYDDVGGWVAARLWWMLDDLGHDRVAVLDGGYPGVGRRRACR